MLVATSRKFVEGPKGVKWDMGIAFLGWAMEFHALRLGFIGQKTNRIWD